MRERSSFDHKIHMFIYHASNAKLEALVQPQKLNINLIFTRSQEQVSFIILTIYEATEFTNNCTAREKNIPEDVK